MTSFITDLVKGAIPSWVLPGVLAVALAGALGTAYVKGEQHKAAADQVVALKLDLKAAEQAAIKAHQAAAQDALLATAANTKADALEAKTQELNAYVSTLESRDSVCLSGADTDRLRGLWH